MVRAKVRPSEVCRVESQEKISCERAIMAVNARFYQAFASRDFEVMDEVWGPSEPIACIHPGWTDDPVRPDPPGGGGGGGGVPRMAVMPCSSDVTRKLPYGGTTHEEQVSAPS